MAGDNEIVSRSKAVLRANGLMVNTHGEAQVQPSALFNSTLNTDKIHVYSWEGRDTGLPSTNNTHAPLTEDWQRFLHKY